jgi:hypothetical protein
MFSLVYLRHCVEGAVPSAAVAQLLYVLFVCLLLEALEGDDHELRAHHRHPPDDTSRRRQLGEQFRCQDFGHSCPSVLESRVSVQKRARSEEEGQ